MLKQPILVTGATGFVGSHLLSALQEFSCTVIGAVRNPDSRLSQTSFPAVTVGNIHGSTDWQPALKNIHTVIHLAARAHQLNDTATDPDKAFWEVNTEGTANLVKQSIAAGVQRFIFISSIGAMATLSAEVLTEMSPCYPDTPYGRSKLAAEQSLMNLAQNTPMSWTVLRPTLVYGPGNPGNMERLLKLLNTNLPLPLGAIKNRRSFIYVGNLVDIILKTLTHPNAQNQIFVCSDGQDLSTPELIRLMAQSSHQPCRLIPAPLPLLQLGGYIGDSIQRLSGRSFILNSETLERLTGSLAVDISNLRYQLDWNPPYTIRTGLQALFT